MTDPIETAELVAFTKIIEAKSLSRAAEELNVPRATVGRRLARLEARLGVRLLRRTTRALALTDAGEAFLRHAQIVLAAVSQAEESVRTSASVIRGTLRVSTPPMIDDTFNALVCTFAKDFPDVAIQVSSAARHVDLLREGYDVALRASTDLEPGLVARTLVRMPVLAVASPAYLALHGVPKTIRDLRSHKCLLGFVRGELPQTYWPRSGGGKVLVEGSFVSNDIRLLADAALRGLGIAVLPMVLIAASLRRGDLVRVLPDLIDAESRLAVVYPEKELLPPQVRAFIEAVVAWAPEGLSLMRISDECREAVSAAPRTRRTKSKPRARTRSLVGRPAAR